MAEMAREDLNWLTAIPFAHRGLYDATIGIPENTRASVKAAVESGFAIEIDAQLTVDGILIAFHDQNLNRLIGLDQIVNKMTWNDISEHVIKGSTETIPTVKDILGIIDGKVPLIIEIREKHGLGLQAVGAVIDALSGYSGNFAIMSSNPVICSVLRHIAPNIVRGSLRTQYTPYRADCGVSRPIAKGIELAHAIQLEKPHYIVWDVRYIELSTTRRLREYPGQPLLCWPITSPSQSEAVRNAGVDNIIFEQYRP